VFSFSDWLLVVLGFFLASERILMDIIISLEPVGSKKIVDFWNCSELIKGTKK
jgi:hypothetical protein